MTANFNRDLVRLTEIQEERGYLVLADPRDFVPGDVLTETYFNRSLTGAGARVISKTDFEDLKTQCEMHTPGKYVYRDPVFRYYRVRVE